ncbi:MAG TPA: beta-galactosidase trimerization domain-containing protein [Armatimonadota bacterium]|nr:beta-galactosidase trimerization domain-containing protein [Armatimonadota bacterium]
MLHITPPASTLVTDQHPYRLRVACAVAGPPATAHVAVELRGPGPDPLVAEARVSVRGDFDVLLSGAPLAEGEYAGTLRVEVAGETACREIRFRRLAAPLDAPFPFGIYAVQPPRDDEEWEALLAALQGAGINLICQHLGGLGGEWARLFDRAACRGIRFMPSDTLDRAGIEARDEWLDHLQGDDPGRQRRRVCLNQPAVRARAAAAFADHLAEYRAHPGFSTLVYYGDDLFLRVHYQRGAVGLSCYCERCRQDFAARYGYAPPQTTAAAAGVVSADHPWLQWHRYRCGVVFGGFIAALEEAKREVDPSIAVGLCHGWPHQPFSHLASGIYGPLTQPTSAVSSYCYPYLRSPRADLICHYEIGRMGHREKDVWMLGAINSNRTLYPAWMVYQNYWNMVAAGYRFIAFFSWWDCAKELERQASGTSPLVDEELRALAACARHKDWILQTAKHWRPAPADCAVLYSFTAEAFDIAPDHRGHLHTEKVCALYRAMLRHNVPMEVIGEEEVLDGILARYRAVCLTGVRVLPDHVHRALEQYIERGGTVLVEQDLLFYDWEPPRVQLRGALEMAPETMAQVLRDQITPAVSSSNPDVIARRLVCGDTEYFVFVNNYADRYWGLPFRYDDPAGNYRDIALVRDAAAQTRLAFARRGFYLFDLTTGEEMGRTDAPLTLTLPPSWGKAVIALPGPVRAAVEGDTHIARGEAAAFTITMRDAAGRPVSGAFTVQVTFTSPSGRPSGCSGYVGLEDGTGHLRLPVGINDEPGPWRLTVTGGFPRGEVHATVHVAPGSRPVDLLEIRPPAAAGW